MDNKGKYILNKRVLVSIPTNNNPFSESLMDVKSKGGQTGEYLSVLASASIHNKVGQHTKAVVDAVDAIEHIYLVDVITNQITDDALAPRVADDDIFSYKVEGNEKLEKILNDMKRDINLDEIVENITPEVIKYGEYILRTEIVDSKESKESVNTAPNGRLKSKRGGVVALVDDVEQGTVVAVNSSVGTESYIDIDPTSGAVKFAEFADYVRFSIGSKRIKVDTKKLVPAHANNDTKMRKLYNALPRYIRVGRSMIYPYIDKILQVDMLEKLSPAIKIDNISRGNIIGMPVPEGYDVAKAKMASEYYESLLNTKVSIDPRNMELTNANIIATAGRHRVLPVFGDKGQLSTIDTGKEAESNIIEESREARDTLFSSVGVPPELIYPSKDGESKNEILKRNAKYVRKLRKVQKALASGLRDLAFIHLENCGEDDYDEDLITVQFNKNLVDVENLDQIERDEATIAGATTFLEFIRTATEDDSPYRDNINLNAGIQYLDEVFTSINISGLVVTETEKKDSQRKDILLKKDLVQSPPSDGDTDMGF